MNTDYCCFGHFPSLNDFLRYPGKQESAKRKIRQDTWHTFGQVVGTLVKLQQKCEKSNQPKLLENVTAPVAGVASRLGSILPAPIWPQNDHYPGATASFLEFSVHPLLIHLIPTKSLFKLALNWKKILGDKIHQMEEAVGVESCQQECSPRKDAVDCFVSGKGHRPWWQLVTALWILAFATMPEKSEWNVCNTENVERKPQTKKLAGFNGFAVDMQANDLKRARALLPCVTCLHLLGAVPMTRGCIFAF